jgi:hypothetical protein
MLSLCVFTCCAAADTVTDIRQKTTCRRIKIISSHRGDFHPEMSSVTRFTTLPIFFPSSDFRLHFRINGRKIGCFVINEDFEEAALQIYGMHIGLVVKRLTEIWHMILLSALLFRTRVSKRLVHN